MKQRVFTLMWGTAWKRYGRKFAESFRKHWPRDVELMIVTDRTLPVEWATQILLTDVPGYTRFMFDYRHDPRACGYGSKNRKANPEKRFWKNDAVKWAPQGLCAVAGLDGLEDGDLLTWMDADVMTIADVPRSWANVLLDGSDIACLQRAQQHSEIGFWAVRVGPGTRGMIAAFNRFYADGSVFGLPEWHSAFVFDKALAGVPSLKVRNLVPPGMRGNVWIRTPLNQFTWHLKGRLKDQ